MQNEVTACYWEYKVSVNVGVDMFKRIKKKMYVSFFKKKNCLLVNCFLKFINNLGV